MRKTIHGQAIWHLNEASEALLEILMQYQSSSYKGDAASVETDFVHLYHHLNSAWHLIHKPREHISDKDWYEMSLIPNDLAVAIEEWARLGAKDPNASSAPKQKSKPRPSNRV